MNTYDPDTPPIPEEWLALDEQVRTLLVQQYHRDNRIPVPKRARVVHAVLHAAVENQLALGDPPVVEALDRLRKEGLSRHEAINAISSVLVRTLNGAMDGDVTDESATEDYYAGVARLTKQSWYENSAG